MNNKLEIVLAGLEEDMLVPVDMVLHLAEEGYDISSLYDRIDGYSVIDTILNNDMEFNEYY
jgi:hypothetical protein